MKPLGLILIIFTGAAAGYAISVRINVKVSFFEEIYSFISQLKIRIRFSGDALLELLCDTSRLILLKRHIETVAEYMESGESFIFAWEAASELTAKDYSLDSEDKKLLVQLGEGLGVSDTEGQITHLELCAQLVRTRLEQIRLEAENKTKVYRLLGVLGGAAAAVMLV